MTFLDELHALQSECEYSDEPDDSGETYRHPVTGAEVSSSVDALIDYKNALEDWTGRLHQQVEDLRAELLAGGRFRARAEAWGTISAALDDNAAGRSHSAASDVCQVGFELQERLNRESP